MKLLRKDLVKVKLYRDVIEDCSYLGTECVPVFEGVFDAAVRGLESKLSAESYGGKISEMLTLFVELPINILIGDVVAFENGNAYRIISVSKFNYYAELTAEKTERKFSN